MFTERCDQSISPARADVAIALPMWHEQVDIEQRLAMITRRAIGDAIPRHRDSLLIL
jgi:hypothetical protein